MTQNEREQYLFFAFVFDDNLHMMAQALIQLGGVQLKPSRLITLMLGYNVSEYMGMMGEIVNMPPGDIDGWKRRYFEALQEEEERRAAREEEKIEKEKRRTMREEAKKQRAKKRLARRRGRRKTVKKRKPANKKDDREKE